LTECVIYDLTQTGEFSQIIRSEDRRRGKRRAGLGAGNATAGRREQLPDRRSEPLAMTTSSEEAWTPQKALWTGMERNAGYEKESCEIRANNILNDVESHSVDPRERAHLIRNSLEIMNAWDDVEGVLFLLLRKLDSPQEDKN
jgi:hypothetical protein